jgi:predicted RNase H-like nuclease (RuvC/YqgF family)
VGIGAGIKTGYAVLDLNGRLVASERIAEKLRN